MVNKKRHPWAWALGILGALALAYGLWILAEFDDYERNQQRIERQQDDDAMSVLSQAAQPTSSVPSGCAREARS
ncbi:hypothetical protein [Cellulosimicrobium cellulans]|uniref:hypothetical protein n=1 Tax=Cellulosimicrobium cellulans TaxID=1710 RepID=UPI002405693C|nr:hypothetical protein [Cellulosimicrobium cellulans]MDF9877471.1 hypothetical protein [Cellulosimicrobium cellulans]